MPSSLLPHSRFHVRHRTQLSLLAALILVVMPRFAQAQDTTQTVLPNIAPREVEIRGELEISLPSLERQPLVGFNPPPRVPNIPSDRVPFVESYREASADLPESPLSRPVPPSALPAMNPERGTVEVLAGRYYSRAAGARITAPIGSQASFNTRLAYQGSEGHQPDEDFEEVKSSFDVVEGQAAIRAAGSRLGGGVAVNGFYELYDLFGATISPFIDNPVPTREGRSIGVAGQLRTIAETAVGARLLATFDATEYKTLFDDDGEITATTEVLLSEQRLAANGNLDVPVQDFTFWLDGKASAGRLSDDLGRSTAAEAGAGLRLQLGTGLRLTAGGRFLGAFSETDTDDEVQRVGYFSPDVRLEAVPSPGLLLFAQNKPGVDANALADVFRTNPYLLARPDLRPTLRAIDAEAGFTVYSGPFQLSGRGGYRQMPQYQFFEAHPDFDQSFTALRYGEAEMYHGGGQVAVVLPQGLFVSVGATYRDGRLTEQDTDIPYFAPIVGEASLSFAFDDNRGFLQVRGHYESVREIVRDDDEEIGAYFDLDTEASYRVTNLIGVVVRVENIGGSDNSRWARYPQAPTVLSAGLRVQW